MTKKKKLFFLNGKSMRVVCIKYGALLCSVLVFAGVSISKTQPELVAGKTAYQNSVKHSVNSIIDNSDFNDSISQKRIEFNQLNSQDAVLQELQSPSNQLHDLVTNPHCQSIYISEYLPTYNESAIEKCENLLSKLENQKLFDSYVENLCVSTKSLDVERQKMGEIQLRLRKYALTFPQVNGQVLAEDVDGFYGPKTCKMIAQYQLHIKADRVDGLPSISVLTSLNNAMPLLESEMQLIAWFSDPVVEQYSHFYDSPEEVGPKDVQLKVPTNPFKQIYFCFRHPEIEECSRKNLNVHSGEIEVSSR